MNIMDVNNPSTWNVLLVDDEPDNLEVIAETLMFLGATAHTAGSGADALSILATFTPNLILLDLSMPQMSGWELRTRIKAMPQYQQVPVLAVSAHAMLGDKERAIESGFNGYLTKPINIATLIKDIAYALREYVKLPTTGQLKPPTPETPAVSVKAPTAPVGTPAVPVVGPTADGAGAAGTDAGVGTVVTPPTPAQPLPVEPPKTETHTEQKPSPDSAVMGVAADPAFVPVPVKLSPNGQVQTGELNLPAENR